VIVQTLAYLRAVESVAGWSIVVLLIASTACLLLGFVTPIAAVVIAMIVMFLFSPRISAFIHKHPTLKMLALSFLVMIGLSLIIEGWDSEKAEDLHLKNYIYFGIAFSFGVEMLNMVMRKRMAKPKVVQLNEPQLRDNEPEGSDQAH